MRKSALFLSIFFIILLLPGFDMLAQQTYSSSDRTENAIFTLQVEYDVENTLFRKHLEDHARLSAERAVIDEKLRELYSEMDSLLKKDNPPTLTSIELKEAEINDVEKQRLANMEDSNNCIEKIKERLIKLSMIEQKIADLKGTLPRDEDTVTGRWDVTLLPGGDKGIFMLKQSGTIITGQYQLEGGWKGSIQGTLVDRKVFLQKIDSKLGRSGEFEGFLSHDGRTIRGTWMDYELSGGKSPSGSWSATRREG